jgi:hypothetical protein
LPRVDVALQHNAIDWRPDLCLGEVGFVELELSLGHSDIGVRARQRGHRPTMRGARCIDVEGRDYFLVRKRRLPRQIALLLDARGVDLFDFCLRCRDPRLRALDDGDQLVCVQLCHELCERGQLAASLLSLRPCRAARDRW